MSKEQKRKAPPSAVKRFPRYLGLLQAMMEEGVQWTSSQDLADRLGLTSSTVRQDLSHLDYSGTSKRGYEVARLTVVLEHVLGADTRWHVVVVGAGNLGRALAQHEEFGRRGFTICGICDTDPKKIGSRVGPLTIQSLDSLSALVEKQHIDLGMIAVPGDAAQSVADALIASGVQGLLNLTLTHLVTPESVSVVDSRIVASLLELTHAMKLEG